MIREGLAFELRIDLQRQRGRIQELPRLGDETLVEGSGVKRAFEEILAVFNKLRLQLRLPAILILPVCPRPVAGGREVHFLRHSHHQIDPEQIIQTLVVCPRSFQDPRVEVLLQILDDGGEKALVEQLFIYFVSANTQFVALKEPESHPEGAPFIYLFGGLQGVEPFDQGPDLAVSVRYSGGWLLQQGYLLGEVCNRGPVADKTDDPEGKHEAHGAEDGAEGRHPQETMAPLHRRIEARQLRFRKNDLPEQAGDEIALAPAAEERGALPVKAVGGGQDSHDTIDGGAFLRTAGQINSPQQQFRFIAAPSAGIV